ncbi:protein roadkill-like [Copidosoma floridanum]|uniref:protein roadkill-like n=1 Tax=Copidosoma floridanum TaxID=29053 RepID=UPI0006C975E9|nr:protein roadkill-like [Copidosoma floridanum]
MQGVVDVGFDFIQQHFHFEQTQWSTEYRVLPCPSNNTYEIQFSFPQVHVRPTENQQCMSDSDLESDSETDDSRPRKNVSLQQKMKALDDYEMLLNNNSLSDINININGKTLHAHRCILSVKSLVFANMFTKNMVEKNTNTVLINDITYEAFHEMLRFMYTGEIKDINMAADLLYAADKYQIKDLKTICIENLVTNINADNIVGYFHLAERHNSETLKSKTVKFLLNNAQTVIEKSEFKELSNINPIFYEIFKAIASKLK